MCMEFIVTARLLWRTSRLSWRQRRLRSRWCWAAWHSPRRPVLFSREAWFNRGFSKRERCSLQVLFSKLGPFRKLSLDARVELLPFGLGLSSKRISPSGASFSGPFRSMARSSSTSYDGLDFSHSASPMLSVPRSAAAQPK